MGCIMQIGYLDGVTPSVVCWMKNRNEDKSFNSMTVAYGFGGGDTFKEQWKFKQHGEDLGAESHQIRVEDVDYDGYDEVLHIGYCLNHDDTLRYTLPEVIHGDRFHVAPFSNAENGKTMTGYGIQQLNETGLLEYTYNAATGQFLWKNYTGDGTTFDVGRGDIGDIDPTHNGYEVWSFQGIYDKNGEKLSDTSTYPATRIYWDGDLLSKQYNDTKIEKWNYETKAVERLATTWKIYECTSNVRYTPMFMGDILGDWREEIVCTNYDYSEIVIISTMIPTEYRLNTLAQDTVYRNEMTSKGYVRSAMLSYYMGEGMDMPEQPNINIVGSVAIAENTAYAIRNTNGGRCMDVYKSSSADGTNVQQYSTVANKAGNTWTVKKAGDDYYYIISQLSDGTTGYLTVAGGENKDGTNVEIFSFKGDDSQKFKLKRNSDGSYMILTKVSGEKRCVEVINAETGAGANIQQWVLTGSTCQNWYFENLTA